MYFERQQKAISENLIATAIYLSPFLIPTSPKHTTVTVLLEKLTARQLVKKSPSFYAARGFITVFTTARHFSLTEARLILSTLTIICPWASIFPSNLHPGLSSVFSSVFRHQNSVRISPLPNACYMPRPTSSSFNNSDNVGESWWFWSSSQCIFLHFPVTSSILVTNVFLSTLPWIPSAYVLPSMWQTKFHTHTKQTKL